MKQEFEQMHQQLTAWRRALHRMPEVGMQLPQTMGFLCAELGKMGIAYTFHEHSCCIEATLGQGKNCILLRADADGLPIAEAADVPFAATNANMHACGHDLHAAMLLGAAKWLKAHESEIPGRVRLLWQSGEESFRGAAAAVRTGVLNGVQAAFSMHVIAMLPMGIALTGKRPMAAVDGFRITLTGRGGHGSMPEAAIDPINAGVQVYLALQSLMAREVSATQEAVLTVGHFSAGQSDNIIPQEAVLEGTLRTFGAELRQRLNIRMEQIAHAVAEAYRCRCEYRKTSCCAGVVTDETVTAAAGRALAKIAPQMQWREDAHGMGSEDFAQIAENVPSGYVMLGAGPQAEEKRYPQHHPQIEFDENILPVGAALYAGTAMQWLREREERA